MVNKRLKIGLLLMIAVTLAACGLIPTRQNPAADQEIVRTAEVTRGDLNVTVAASGNTSANEVRDLYFKRDGEIAAVFVEESDFIGVNDIIATLDTSNLERQVRQGEINLEQARINLDRVLNSTPEQRDVEFAELSYNNAWQSLELARMGIRNAEIQVEEMRVQAQRAREQAHLKLQEAIQAGTGVERAQSNYDSALEQEYISKLNSEALLAQARANYQSAYYRFKQAERSQALLEQDPRETQIRQLETQLAIAELALNQSRNALNDTPLVSPVSGKVVAVNVNAGDSYRTSAPAITVVDESVYFVDITVDEIDIGKVTPGLRADITLDAYETTVLTGIVESINPAPTNLGGIVTYPVRIRLEDVTDVDIRAGMTANVLIYIRSIKDVLQIPLWSIRTDSLSGNTYCYVVIDNLPVRTDIELGAIGDSAAEVLSGLKTGDTVGLIPEERNLPFGQ